MKQNNIWHRAVLTSIAAVLMATQAGAQQSASYDIPTSEAPFSAADLQLLVGPVALYADDLIGIVLPASTYPLQIVQASRFLDALESDDSLQPDPDWDDSVVALLNYPELLRLMDANLEWTWTLGEAVLDQQAAVLDAIQSFRRLALESGNLTSDDRQLVDDSGTLIEISPAEPEVIYIPYYEPERVVVYQPRPVIHYYSHAYPIYYYPYPFGFGFDYRFGSSFFWGVTSAFNIGWHSHVVHVYHHRHRAHPYYDRVYYTPYFARRSISLGYRNDVWRSRQRPAARPRRIETRTVATREGAGTRTVVTRERAGSTAPPRARSTTRIAGSDGNSGREYSARRQTGQTATGTRNTAERSVTDRQPTTSNPGTFTTGRSRVTDIDRNAAARTRQPATGAGAQVRERSVARPSAPVRQDTQSSRQNSRPAVPSGGGSVGLGSRSAPVYERTPRSSGAASGSGRVTAPPTARSPAAASGATRSAPRAATRSNNTSNGGRTRRQR